MTEVKILNPKMRFSTAEVVELSLYAQDSGFPESGLSFSVGVYSGDSLVGSATFEEDFFVKGKYVSDVESQVGTLSGNINLFVKESGTIYASLSITKGVVLSAFEYVDPTNKKVVSNIAQESVDYRNVVVGALDSISIERKPYTSSSFELPSTIYVSYFKPSTRSDYAEVSPVILNPLSYTEAYVDGFEGVSWASEAYTDGFEDTGWDLLAYVEGFDSNNWL